MVSLNECIGMCGLHEDEVALVAEHEHLPLVVAAELAQTLLQTPSGLHRLHDIFHDCMATQAARRDSARQRELARIYAAFRERHPTP
ncbi:MAG TPA: hypothetical protein VMC81_12125 [Rhodocyclaceae bacterium]|nr:hypothetical protein [Rhodocyclaceae bacterium]